MVRRVGAAAVAALVLPAAAAATPVVTVAKAPEALAFGDELHLRVDVRFRPGEVVPGSVRVGGLEPWVVLRQTATAVPGAASVSLTLLCARAACLGKHEGLDRRFALAAQVTWRGRDGAGAAAAAVPPFSVASRVTPADTLAPRFKVRLEPLPPIAYRVPPRRAAFAAFAAAGLLALAALALLALAFGRRRRPRRLRPAGGLTGLERALVIVRRAAAAGVPGERRRALDRLARELDATPAAPLGGPTRRLAWSSEPPEPDAVARIADEVEQAATGRGDAR